MLLVCICSFLMARDVFVKNRWWIRCKHKKCVTSKPSIKALRFCASKQRDIQDEIHDWAVTSRTNNVVTRNMQVSCYDLRNFDMSQPCNTESYRIVLPNMLRCYGCNNLCHRTHPVYVFSCLNCGDMFQRYRHLTRDLTGQVALVIGARTKLGHQVVIKLLEAGATVIGTTRYPEAATRLFESYSEWPIWQKRLKFFPESFDLDINTIREAANNLRVFCEVDINALDILIVCAAQTIRVREKQPVINGVDDDRNRYGDAKFVKQTLVNSWQMELSDLVQHEMEEVYRINAIAPCIVMQQLESLMRRSSHDPYVINVHAREGLFEVSKSRFHIHTNMAKAGLAMFTKCLKSCRLKTIGGKRFRVHGVDPGWISVDEYYENNKPWKKPPLDEVDGAARILFPIFYNLEGSYTKTRRHFRQLKH